MTYVVFDEPFDYEDLPENYLEILKEVRENLWQERNKNIGIVTDSATNHYQMTPTFGRDLTTKELNDNG